MSSLTRRTSNGNGQNGSAGDETRIYVRAAFACLWSGVLCLIFFGLPLPQAWHYARLEGIHDHLPLGWPLLESSACYLAGLPCLAPRVRLADVVGVGLVARISRRFPFRQLLPGPGRSRPRLGALAGHCPVRPVPLFPGACRPAGSCPGDNVPGTRAIDGPDSACLCGDTLANDDGPRPDALADGRQSQPQGVGPGLA